MADNISKQLIGRFNCLLDDEVNSDNGIALLGDIVQAFVEEDNLFSAYRYQTQKYDIAKSIYGENNIKTERAAMYLRELKIRTSPVSDRVGLCREFYESTKEKYGTNSYAISKLVAPLYLLCCEEAREYEEMSILCREIISVYKDSNDDSDHQLVLLCKATERLHGKTQGDIYTLEDLCKQSAKAFSAGSETTLILLHCLGLSYRNSDDVGQYEKCIDIHSAAFQTALNTLGINNRITLMIACDLAEDFALNGQFKDALSLADKIVDICKKTDSSVERPNTDNVYFLIYSKMGKQKQAEKYANKALQFEIKKYGIGDGDVINSGIKSTAYAFLNKPNEKRFLDLSDAVTEKLDTSFLSFLAFSGSDRMAYFSARQNQNFFKIYSTVSIEHTNILSSSNQALLSFWENLCNRKTFLSDCELIHNSFARNKNFGDMIERLQDAENKSDEYLIVEIRRQIIGFLREFDYNSYSKSINVKDIQTSLKPGEVLFDFYILDSIGGKEYVVIKATENELDFALLGPADTVDSAISKFVETVKDAHSENTGVLNNIRHNRVYQSLEKLGIDSYKKVYISPDGCLYRIPFDIFFNSAIFYVINPKDLARNKDENTNNSINKATVFGNPKFDLENMQDPSKERGAILSSLPGTFIEAQIVKNLFGEKADIYINEEANVYNFCKASFGEIVHIGTHANTDGDGKLFFSGINDISNGVFVPDCYKEGCLSSGEIANLDFSRTDLVVLSACDTAAGRYQDYLGLRSIARAFRLAGAKKIVAALWAVDDFSTMLFMKKFYEFYLQTYDVADSLNRAKTYFKRTNLGTIKRKDIPLISDILLQNGETDIYRRIRDRFSLSVEDDKLFAHPYFWAGFQVFQ